MRDRTLWVCLSIYSALFDREIVVGMKQTLGPIFLTLYWLGNAKQPTALGMMNDGWDDTYLRVGLNS